MTTLFVLWHLGLGDAILCNGLVRTLAGKRKRLALPVKDRNLASVSAMFSDLDNISIVPVKDDDDAVALAKEYPSLRLGLFSKKGCEFKAWDRQFYEQAGVEFEMRWKAFALPCPLPELPIAPAPYAFVHDDEKRGYAVKRGLPEHLSIQRPKLTKSIFDHLPLLRQASEIHCIDSSFALLADSIPCQAKRYCLHAYARTGPSALPAYRKPWEILK